MIAENGRFGQIEEQVSRLLRSTAACAFLLITSSNEENGISIWNHDGVSEFSFFIDWRYRPELEQAIRAFFTRRGLSTTLDYLAGNGVTRDAMRCIFYTISARVRIITDLARKVLAVTCGLAEQETLKFIHSKF